MSRFLACLGVVLLLEPARLGAEPLRPDYPPVAEVRAAFRKLLDRPAVPLNVKAQEPRTEGGMVTERLTFASEKRVDGEEERVPVLVLRPEKAMKPRQPAVIVLHGTGGNKDAMRGWLVELARRGIIGVAIDARYHGDRAGGEKGAVAYNRAIVRAWQANPAKQELPFYFDTCWDVWKTVDYLATRDDVDVKNLGVIGISMGGIETWLAATTDERVKVLIPLVAVQSFRWSLENDRWQARANTIRAAHEAAARDLGEQEVNQKVCRALWSKVVPGILDRFDCPSMIRLAAGRPLLILSGELDPNCPLEGARLAISRAEEAYTRAEADDRLRVVVEKGVKHAVTESMRRDALDWCEKWLK